MYVLINDGAWERLDARVETGDNRQVGVTANRIAVQKNTNRRTVSVVWRRIIQTGKHAVTARSGHPNKITLR